MDNLKGILDTYEVYSGQMINKAKTAIFFSPNTRSDVKSRITTSLCISTVTMNEQYLGLPTHVGRSKNQTFKSIEKRVWKRLQLWK